MFTIEIEYGRKAPWKPYIVTWYLSYLHLKLKVKLHCSDQQVSSFLLLLYSCFSLKSWVGTDYWSQSWPVREITAKIPDVNHCISSIVFTTTAVFNPTTWISDIVYCVYSVVFTTTTRSTLAGKILYILQRFRNPRHQNCDSCTMAETYRIYYSGIVYHPPSHLRRRKTYSGEDLMLAGW